jgi:hypothetical protein
MFPVIKALSIRMGGKQMLNLTLTITAAPELLAAMSSFSKAITAAKVVTIPEYSSDFADHKTSKEQTMQAQAPVGVTRMYNQPSTVPVNQMNTQGAAVPTSTQSYTMEQLAVAATQIVDAGHRAELVSLLSSFGVQALTALPKDQYGAFATQLRALGSKI